MCGFRVLDVSVLLLLLAALLGLCVLVAAVALRRALAWMDGELCPICERPVERCAGHEVKS